MGTHSSAGRAGQLTPALSQHRHTFPAPSFWQDNEFAPKHTWSLCRALQIMELGWQGWDLLGSQGCCAQQLLPNWKRQASPHLGDMREILTSRGLCLIFLAATGMDLETDHKCSTLGTPCHSPRWELAEVEVRRALSTPEWDTHPAPQHPPSKYPSAPPHGFCSLPVSHQA